MALYSKERKTLLKKNKEVENYRKLVALAKAELTKMDEEMKAKDVLIATIELEEISNDKPVEQTNKDSNPEILIDIEIKKCKM